MILVAADQAVAGTRMEAFADRLIAVVGIDQSQAQRLGEIEREEARRQEAGRYVAVAQPRCGTGIALLGDGGEAVVGGDDDVGVLGEPELGEGGADAAEVVVDIADRRQRGRPVDAGLHAEEAVALIVLGAVGIARPEHQQEGLVARREHRQHRPRGRGHR